MQLNFLQEDLAATLQKSKKNSAHKPNTPVLSKDLFGGLPLAMPTQKPLPKIEAKTEDKPTEKSAPQLTSAAIEKPTEKPLEKVAEKATAETSKKSENAFKTISEVASLLDVPQHVLRFWESRFSQIKPLKMGGGRRYYRPEDIDVLSKIQNLLYKQGYTIKGAKKAISMKEVKAVEAIPQETAKKTFVLSDKQKKQVTALKNELVGLRETLRPYLANKIPA